MPRINVYYSEKDKKLIDEAKQLARIQSAARGEPITFSKLVIEGIRNLIYGKKDFS